jgi:peptide/nickel transport system substrate-binding protein
MNKALHEPGERSEMIDWRTLIAVSLLGSTLIAGVAMAQTLRIGLAEDPDVLDPTLSRTFVSGVVRAALCDRLFDIGLELEIAPQLATAWEWTDDRKGLVVKLRPGVKFHDGESFDAAAVKFNIERHLTMLGSTRKSDIKAITSIEIIDEYTVKFVLSAPFAPLLAQLAGSAGTMVSPKAALATGENFGSHPVCTGPFKFVEHVAQDRIVVERFADYWDKDKIKVDRIVYLPIPDTTVRLANLRSGGLDLTQIAATDLDTVRKDSRLKLTAVNGIGYSGITLNVANGEGSKTPLGRDARVRQALELSIDREVLNQVVFNGENQPGNQWVAPTNPYYVRELPIQARDVTKAKALLAAAAAPNPVIAMTATNNPVVMHAAQVVQAMAKESGFDIRIQATEFASALQLAAKGDFEAFMLGWTGRIDPDGNIYNLVTCNSPFNDGHYCNPEVDRELDAARTVDARADRLAHYRIVAERLMRDLPIIYLYHAKWLYASTARLSGFIPYPDGLIRPQDLRLD